VNSQLQTGFPKLVVLSDRMGLRVQNPRITTDSGTQLEIATKKTDPSLLCPVPNIIFQKTMWNLNISRELHH